MTSTENKETYIRMLKNRKKVLCLNTYYVVVGKIGGNFGRADFRYLENVVHEVNTIR